MAPDVLEVKSESTKANTAWALTFVSFEGWFRATVVHSLLQFISLKVKLHHGMLDSYDLISPHTYTLPPYLNKHTYTHSNGTTGRLLLMYYSSEHTVHRPHTCIIPCNTPVYTRLFCIKPKLNYYNTWPANSHPIINDKNTFNPLTDSMKISIV